MQVQGLLFVGGDLEQEGKYAASPGLGDEHHVLVSVVEWLHNIGRGDAGHTPETLNLQVCVVEVIQHVEHLDLAVGGEVQVVQVDTASPAEGVVAVVYDHDNIPSNVDMVDLLGFCLEGAIGKGLEGTHSGDVHVDLLTPLAE